MINDHRSNGPRDGNQEYCIFTARFTLVFIRFLNGLDERFVLFQMTNGAAKGITSERIREDLRDHNF